jgi:hypothetical protein
MGWKPGQWWANRKKQKTERRKAWLIGGVLVVISLVIISVTIHHQKIKAFFTKAK